MIRKKFFENYISFPNIVWIDSKESHKSVSWLVENTVSGYSFCHIKICVFLQYKFNKVVYIPLQCKNPVV